MTSDGRLLADLDHDVVPLALPIDRAATIETFLTIVASSMASIDAIAALKGQRTPDVRLAANSRSPSPGSSAAPPCDARGCARSAGRRHHGGCVVSVQPV